MAFSFCLDMTQAYISCINLGATFAVTEITPLPPRSIKDSAVASSPLKIEKWEGNLVEPRSKNFQDVINFPNKLNSEFLQLRGVADSHDPRLTKGAQDRAHDVKTDWAKYKSQMNQLIEKDIAEYNRVFREKNMPALMPEKKDAIINN